MSVDQLKTIAEIVQSSVSAAAILFGGFWAIREYIWKRKRYPKIKISQNIFNTLIDKSKRLIRVTIFIENNCYTLFRLKEVMVRILQIEPWPDEIFDEAKMRKPHDSSYDWPYLDERSVSKDTVELEPNESEEISFDFIIDAKVKIIGVYSFVENPKKHNIGWSKTTLYDLARRKAND